MKIAQLLYEKNRLKEEINSAALDYTEAQLVLGFGDKKLLSRDLYGNLRDTFPNAEIALCSTSGEIFEESAHENTLSLLALEFSATPIKTAKVAIKDFKDSFEAGRSLMENLKKEDLKWVFVLSDGSRVNGSELVRGLNTHRPEGTIISGGLAGNGLDFFQTLTGLNEPPEEGNIIAIGFYGENLQLSHASRGGWESFGLERTITRSSSNKLFEIDGKNALELYKKYLGKYAEELPQSAFLFPLALKLGADHEPVVRTILSIDEEEQSMTFAGDMPETGKVRFMKSNLDRLISAANDAAQECVAFHKTPPQLAMVVSCIGRKLVLRDRLSEEIESIREVMGPGSAIMGFYAYGEISPNRPFSQCELHNQTITITGIDEIVSL